jgi:hypothetical protein
MAMTLTATLGLGVLGCAGDGKEKNYGHDHDHGDSKEVVIAEKDVPEAVMNGVRKTYSGAKIGKVEKETYADGTVHYEFDLKLPNGDIEEVEFNDQGEKLDDH